MITLAIALKILLTSLIVFVCTVFTGTLLSKEIRQNNLAITIWGICFFGSTIIALTSLFAVIWLL